MFFEQYSHEPYIAVARFIVLYQGRAVEETGRLVMLRERGYQALSVMEKTLQQSPYLAGDRPSIADIALYAYTHVANEGGFDLSAYPAILQWIGSLKQLPGWVNMSQACR